MKTFKELLETHLNVGDSVWVKHPTDKSRTLTGKITKVGRTGYTVKHKDNTEASYSHKDVTSDYPHKNPYAKNESVEELDEASVSWKHSAVMKNKETGKFHSSSMNVYGNRVVHKQGHDTAEAAKEHGNTLTKSKRTTASHPSEKTSDFERVNESTTLNVGDFAIYNKGKTAETVGKVHKIDGDDYILHHQATNTLHRVPKNKTELHESEELDESVIRIQHTDGMGNTHILSSSSQGFVALNKGNSSLANVMHSAPGHNRTGTQEKSEALNKAIKVAHAGGKESVLAAAKKATGLHWTHHSVTEAYTPEPGHKIITKKGGQIPGTVEKLEKDYVYFRHPEGKMFRTHKDNVQKDGSVKESEEIEEGNTATYVKTPLTQQGSKRTVHKSEDDFLKHATELHGKLTVKKHSDNNKDDRKTYHNKDGNLVGHGAGDYDNKNWSWALHSKPIKESEDIEEALTYKQKLTHIRVDPINSTPKHLLGKVGVFGEKDDLSKDEHYKKAMADAHEYGKSKFDGKYEVTHVGHKQDKIRAGSVAKVRKSMEEAVLDEVKAAEDMAGTSATSTKQKSSDLGKSGKKAPGNKNINLAEALSSEEGPAKGAEFKEMSQEQHLECMKYHKDEYNAIKGKTHKYIKELDETGKTESKLKYHAKMYHKHKEAA